jgi:Tfp pilus assembly protein PilZ
MDGSEEEFGKDSVAIQLIKLILDMSYDRQIALLKQLEEIPVATLEVADRDETRKSYSSTVAFSVEGRSYKGASEDISAGGMFIKTDDSFTVGQVITVTIPFFDKKKYARVPAEIVRVKEDGIGVKFMKKSEKGDYHQWLWT